MSKFLVVGDVHYRGTNPRARLDDFQEAISAKLLEVNKLALDYEVDGVFQVGDLFDSPGVGYSVVAELARILQQSHCPWYTVAGNHDIYGANQESLKRTPLGLLAGLEIVELVSEEIKTVQKPLGDYHFVGITGRGYSVDTDGSPEWYSFPANEKSSHDVTINIVHGMLLDKPFGFDIKHQVIESIPNPADITIVGHEHTGFGAICRPDGKWFINPGALCRLSASNTEINRQVQVALLEIDDDLPYDNISVKMIPLNSAEPGHVVLSREHIEEAKQRDERLETFLRLLSSEGEQKYLELEEIMDGIAKKENIPEDVIKEGLLRLGRAREIISGRG